MPALSAMETCKRLQKLKAVLLGLWLSALAACATSPSSGEPSERMPHMIEGYWAMGDAQNVIEMRPCKDDEQKLCGHLIEFAGGKDDRDYLHPGFLSWGQKLCDSLIVADLEQTEEPQIYTGTIYNPDEGQVYALIILVKSHDLIESRIYMGASIDEAISLSIGALTGDVGIFSTLSFLTRAGIGKEHLGETNQWTRHASAIDRCDIL